MTQSFFNHQGLVDSNDDMLNALPRLILRNRHGFVLAVCTLSEFQERKCCFLSSQWQGTWG